MSFCNFVVNSVGDANCIFISNFPDSLMIDCGISNQTDYQNNKLIPIQIKNTRNLLISHYHSDHFKILNYLNNKELNISQLYYPYLPEIEYKTTLIKELLLISYLQQAITISKASDLISLIKQKNRKQFDYAPLYAGNKIFNDSIDVIWPPKKLSPDKENILNKKIKEIDDKIKSIPEISDLWTCFDRFDVDSENQFLKSDMNDSPGIINHNKALLEKYKNEIDDLDSKMKLIANSLSICLYKENEFLFLGDLGKDEVEDCLNSLKNKLKTDKIYVKYFITPHHGTKTHYSESVSAIDAEYVITSNGKKRMEDYVTDYNNLAKYHHYTYENGDFEKNTCRYMINEWLYTHDFF